MYIFVAIESMIRRCGILLSGLAALSVGGSEAAQLAIYPLENFTVSSCRIDLQRDKLRMFWKDENGKVIGQLSKLQTWLRAKGEDLVCATNAGIYDEAHRPLGLYVENGMVLRKVNTR